MLFLTFFISIKNLFTKRSISGCNYWEIYESSGFPKADYIVLLHKTTQTN